MNSFDGRPSRKPEFDPTTMQGLLAVILSACLFLYLCAASVKASDACSSLGTVPLGPASRIVAR